MRNIFKFTKYFQIHKIFSNSQNIFKFTKYFQIYKIQHRNLRNIFKFTKFFRIHKIFSNSQNIFKSTKYFQIHKIFSNSQNIFKFTKYFVDFLCCAHASQLVCSSEAPSNVYNWTAGHPNGSLGACGIVANTSVFQPNASAPPTDYQLSLALEPCESKKPFVCSRRTVNASIGQRKKSVMLCFYVHSYSKLLNHHHNRLRRCYCLRHQSFQCFLYFSDIPQSRHPPHHHYIDPLSPDNADFQHSSSMFQSHMSKHFDLKPSLHLFLYKIMICIHCVFHFHCVQ